MAILFQVHESCKGVFTFLSFPNAMARLVRSLTMSSLQTKYRLERHNKKEKFAKKSGHEKLINQMFRTTSITELLRKSNAYASDIQIWVEHKPPKIQINWIPFQHKMYHLDVTHAINNYAAGNGGNRHIKTNFFYKESNHDLKIW